MGLDAVQIVMAVENAFDIRIENSEAEKMRTPRDLIELVVSKVACADSRICLTQRAFNLVRACLIHRGGLERGEVVPAAALADLVAPAERNQILVGLAGDLGTGALPALTRPRTLTTSLCGFAILTGIGAAVIARSTSITLSFLIIAATAGFTGWVAAFATRHLRTEFAAAIVNVGELSRWVLAHKADLAIPQHRAWTRDQIASRIREIVIETLGCEAHYREDALFVEELGLY